MKKEEADMLASLAKPLEEAGDAAEEAYRKNDAARFNQAKKLILSIQDKISDILA
jgi:hypothetical protein